MPQIHLQSVSLDYYLITFDKNGQERKDDPEGLISAKIVDILTQETITDVFIFSHGWLGDVDDAIFQYNRWVSAMAEQTEDRQKMREKRPGFRPLLIGLHWPSKPFGEEEIQGTFNFGEQNAPEENPLDTLVDFYSETIANTDKARADLRKIITYAAENSAPNTLPQEIVSAYQQLEQEAHLQQEGFTAAPGADREPFDAQKQFHFSLQTPVNFAGPDFSAVLAPLRTLSFWKMKDRARAFGESGGFQLLTKLQQATNADVRFHLMGHSFGAIVVSATVCGPKAQGKLVRPINSLALVQGALSLWSYCPNIPEKPSTDGYFHTLLNTNKVDGPIITTQSEHDTALSIMYPLGAGVAGQISMAPGKLPKYGAVGTFGIHGEHLPLEFLTMLPKNQAYSFSSGVVYNLEGSDFINKKSGRAGAHNDIYKSEVAHAIWAAAMA